jgi:hypothetical protein
MSDIDSGLDNLHIGDQPDSPIREGLPPRFRMRADAHYVEELDSALFSAPIRQIDVRQIDPAQKSGNEPPSAAFIESLRQHGVLQPLLVRSRGGRFQVVAGNKRLAAALEVGLTEVPCLVERIDDDQARALAAATNVPSTAQPAVHARPEPPKADAGFATLAECLTAVASSAGLLTSGSALTQTVAVDLVRAESARALQLLRAVRVLRGDIRPSKQTVTPRAVVRRVVEETEAERRLRGLALTVECDGAESPSISGDEGLLAAAVSALVVAPPALLESGSEGRRVALDVAAKGDAVAIVAEHPGELPLFWRSVLAEEDRREVLVPGGGASWSLTLLRAARHIAEGHGGRMSVDCLDRSTSLSILIPAGR